MPNIITHKIFAEEVLKQLEKQDIRSIIEKHPQSYYMAVTDRIFCFFA